MPALTVPRRDSTRSLVSKVIQREVDEDAGSDWTLDDSGFGAPLQRFQDTEDYGPKAYKLYDNDDRVSLLRRAQDQAWLQAQKEAARAYLGPSFHDVTVDAQVSISTSPQFRCRLIHGSQNYHPAIQTTPTLRDGYFQTSQDPLI